MKASEQVLTTQQLIGNLIKVVHKSLDLYVDDSLKVVKQNPDLFAHLIAWNHINGEIRDTKIAFPVLSLRGNAGEEKSYYENAVAHLLLFDPRNLVKAVTFDRELNSKGVIISGGAGTLLKKAVQNYLRIREENPPWWNKAVVQHRTSMKTLYAMYHVKPNAMADKILFKEQYPKNSVFEAIRQLKNMDPKEAGAAILNYKIPFTIAVGAVGGIAKNTDLVLSLIENMSGNELITNSNMLSKLGVMDNPVLKSAFENAISKAKKDKRTSTLKAGIAASVVNDEKMKVKLEKLQEHKIDNLKGLEGDWLILADKSGSMKESIIKSKEVAAFLARTTKGKVYLVFFNTLPVMYDVSEKSLQEIKTITSGIMAGGGTSIGCGLQLISDKQIIVNGIVICSDGGENTHPHFFEVYKQYEKKYMISPTIYLIHFPGELDVLTIQASGFSYEKLDGKDLDYYGLPNLSNILRSSRYTFVDEIMQVPLLTINSVLQRKEA